MLGPLWLTLSLAVTVAVLSVLYGQLLGLALERYVPHLTLGFIARQFIAGVVARSCDVFVRQKAWILNDRRPLSLFVLMDVWENVLEMAHNAPVYVGVALLYGIFAGAAGLQIVPGLALVLLNALWVGLLLGTVCARFRDIAQIVASVMRIAFFVTPVIWMPEMLGSRAHLALYNPFAYFVEILRAPLLGQAVPALTWLLVLAVTAAGWTATCIVFTRYPGAASPTGCDLHAGHRPRGRVGRLPPLRGGEPLAEEAAARPPHRLAGQLRHAPRGDHPRAARRHAAHPARRARRPDRANGAGKSTLLRCRCRRCRRACWPRQETMMAVTGPCTAVTLLVDEILGAGGDWRGWGCADRENSVKETCVTRRCRVAVV